MFNLQPAAKPAVEEEYDRAVARLKAFMPETEEYATAMKRVRELQDIRVEDRRKSLDPNVVISAAANLVGIGMIIKYEQLNVITTKALGFLPKLR